MDRYIRHIYIFLALITLSSFQGMGAGIHFHAKVEKAGTLAEIIGEKINDIDSLSVEGLLNESDFITLFNMGLHGNLISLNLHKAQPEGNRIPDFAFYHRDSQTFDDGQGERFHRLKIRRITLPANLQEIGVSAFRENMLESIEFPPTLRKLEESCFALCSSLGGELIIPEGITKIGKKSFYGCWYITSLSLPESLQEIAQEAFSSCQRMKLSNPQLNENVKIIGDAAFSYTLDLSEVKLPAKLEYLGLSAFSYSGISRMEIPSNITEVPAYCFSDCDSLKSVILHEGVKTIERGAFYNAPVDSLILPSTLERIEWYALQGLSHLKKIYSLAKDAPSADNAFRFGTRAAIIENVTPTSIPVYVPVGSIECYRSAESGWDYFTNIIECADMPHLDSGIRETFADEHRDCVVIRPDGNGIVITGQITEVGYLVYSVDGKAVAAGKTETGDTRIVLPQGIYVVHAGGKTAKVRL